MTSSTSWRHHALYALLCTGWALKGAAFCATAATPTAAVSVSLAPLLASVVLERLTSALGSSLLDDLKWRLRLRDVTDPTSTDALGMAWSSRADILMRLPVGLLRLGRLVLGCQVVHITAAMPGLVTPSHFLGGACALALMCGSHAFACLRTTRIMPRPTTFYDTVALTLSLCALGLYNLPDGQSHVLRRLLPPAQRRALDQTGLACVAVEALVFAAWVRASAPSCAQIVPPHQRRTALWLALANVVTCAMLAGTTLFYFTHPIIGSSADLLAFVVKVVLVPCLLQRLPATLNPFLKADMARATLACLVLATTSLIASSQLVARLGAIACLWCLDALLDEYNARISTWFAAAQKNVCLLVLMYAMRVHYLHDTDDTRADAAHVALQEVRPWFFLAWCVVLLWGPSRVPRVTPKLEKMSR